MAAPAVALVPPRTDHWVVNLLPDRELHYLYISVWPDGIPANEIDGGWKKVYADIIDSYVSRGYPVEANDRCYLVLLASARISVTVLPDIPFAGRDASFSGLSGAAR